MKGFKEFASTKVPDALSKEEIEWQSAITLHAAASTVRTDLPILAGSIQLYICGRFEYFVRELVGAVADGLVASCKSAEELPEVMRKTLRTKTMEVALNPRRYGYDQHEADLFLLALSKLISPGANEENWDISSEILTLTESNMNQRTLVDLFRRVGIENIWQEVGKQTKIKIYFSQKNDSPSNAQKELDTIMSERNAIAHPTGETSFPDTDKVLGYIEYFKLISGILVESTELATLAS